jgi:hypothetical protein
MTAFKWMGGLFLGSVALTLWHMDRELRRIMEGQYSLGNPLPWR